METALSGIYNNSYSILKDDNSGFRFLDNVIVFTQNEDGSYNGRGFPDEQKDRMFIELDENLSGIWQEYEKVDGEWVAKSEEWSGGEVTFTKLGNAILGIWSGEWGGQQYSGSWRLEEAT